MSTLTLQLPDTLYSQLVTLAQQERVQLTQYILYVLTHQVVSAYTAHEISTDDVEQQRMAFADVRQRLGSASDREIANALARGSHADAIRLLIDQNASVMKTRAGAGAWIELSKDRLMVRYLDAGVADLPPKATIPGLWWNSYFLDAMWNVASELSR